MNPWLILGWVVVVCLSVLLVAVTVSAVVGMFRRSGDAGSADVFRGGDDR